MDTRIQVFAKSEDEAKAWLTVLRTLGLQIVGVPSDRITHDGSWMVRARVAEDDQRQSATVPHQS